MDLLYFSPKMIQDLVGQMVESIFFRFFILGIIVVNSVLIGLQTMEDVVRHVP